MSIFAGFRQKLLYDTSECQFLSDSWNKCDYEQIYDETANSVDIQHLFCEFGGGFFHRFEYFLDFCQRCWKLNVFVPACQQVNGWQGNKHDQYASQNYNCVIGFCEAYLL